MASRPESTALGAAGFLFARRTSFKIRQLTAQTGFGAMAPKTRGQLQTAKARTAPPSPIIRGQHGGAGNRDRFRALLLEAQFAIVMRLLKASAKAYAKKHGKPEPIRPI